MILEIYHIEAVVPAINLHPLPPPAPLKQQQFRPLILGTAHPPRPVGLLRARPEVPERPEPVQQIIRSQNDYPIGINKYYSTV